MHALTGQVKRNGSVCDSTRTSDCDNVSFVALREEIKYARITSYSSSPGLMCVMCVCVFD